MQKYELLYILPTKYTDEEIGGVISKITEEMKAAGVEISRAEQAGKLKLAYPIRRERYGYYVLAAFEGDSAIVKKMNDYLAMNLEILRSAIYRAATHKAAAAVSVLKEMGEISAEAPRVEAPREKKYIPPTPAPVIEKPKMTMEELDKKLDEILEGDIV